MDPRYREILLERAELVTAFPAWMLPAETVERLHAAANAAVVEIAGPDSLAAAVRAAAEGGYDFFLPTIAYTGTEFGDWRLPFEKIEYLQERLRGVAAGAEVLEPVVMGAPELWRLLCGRYVLALYRRFGFYTPCIGCHVYLHALRIPLAKMTGCRVVVAGERENHGGLVKLNQIPITLDAYVELLARFGVELLLPLRHVSSGAEIEEIVGAEGRESAGQLECILSQNYRDADGSVPYDEEAVRRFLDEFALPLAERAVNAYLAGERPDYEALARGFFV
ncbi:MAG TPA: hypothetical protein VMX79_08250 [bacterium]|nr:hypothetical protein [bacterium]